MMGLVLFHAKLWVLFHLLMNVLAVLLHVSLVKHHHIIVFLVMNRLLILISMGLDAFLPVPMAITKMTQLIAANSVRNPVKCVVLLV